jgi:hypothetical protein
MKKSMLLAGAALLLTAAATPARGQATISPGMSAEQVRERFGQPATTRVAGDWVYWYYHNGCPVRCGSDDVVFFRDERVVAAVLRTARRRFAGPAADDALEQAGGNEQADAAPSDGRARVGGVRVEGPATELIVTPSRSDDADRARPRAREGQPGEPSTIVITNPESTAGAPADTPAPTGRAREGRPGEPSTMVITTPAAQDAAPGTAVTATAAPGTNPPDVDGPLPATRQPGATATTPATAPQNTEAADTRGETSIDRKNRRTRQDRSNEPTATQRARQNDGKNP